MKTIKKFGDFINENEQASSKEDRQYNFDGAFYLSAVNDYILSERKFGGDMEGIHGGDEFDFHIDHVYMNEDNNENGEPITKIELDGFFYAPINNTMDKDDLTDCLMEYVGDVVHSYTKHIPQDFNIKISKHKK